MNDTTIPTKAPRSTAMESTIKDGVLTMSFGENGSAGILTVSVADVQTAPNFNDWLLKGIATDLRSRYATKRENPAEAFKAATEARTLLLKDGPGARQTSGEAEMSALETAMLTIAEVKGLPIEKVRAVVDAYKDKDLGDGVILTADAQRKALVAKVKSDPATAALYASKRATKAPEVSILDQF